MSYTVEHNHPEIGRIVSAAFPKNKKTISVREFVGQNVNSYWDSGSRDEYSLVNLSTLEVWHVPHKHPHYDKQTIDLESLPPNCVLVSGGIFRGKTAHCTVSCSADILETHRPVTETVTEQEGKALQVCSMVSSYRKNEWKDDLPGEYGAENPIIVSLEARGLVKINKRGGISLTNNGRNTR